MVADWPVRRVAGAVRVSASTCGRTSVASQLVKLWGTVGGLEQSTPQRDHPVNPPSSGVVAGFLPELPLMKYGTPSTCDAWNVPTCPPMNAACLPVRVWKSPSQDSMVAASLRSDS